MRTWQEKAEHLIAEMVRRAWSDYEPIGDGWRVKPAQRPAHRRYTLPLHAYLLLDCLKRGDEREAKVLMVKLAEQPERMQY